MHPTSSAQLTASVWADRALFFGHWLRHPLGIGAVLPSGKKVAQAMARALPAQPRGLVLELGGGTGSITQGLLEAGCAVDKLVVIEHQPALAAALRRRFPKLPIVAADARSIGAVLAELGVASLGAVVSSLPIKWFSLDDQRAVVAACFARLSEEGVLLQLTNALVSPLPTRELGLDGAEVARVWTQFPPVQIWRYRRAPVPGGAK
jgi:phosphatidylethanolamine/phosphatidyl-N-methylethanolamine N-methyltransferase